MKVITKAKPKAKTKEKSLQELLPWLSETPEQKRARRERLIAGLNSPLFKESFGDEAAVGKELFKALSKSRGHKN